MLGHCPVPSLNKEGWLTLEKASNHQYFAICNHIDIGKGSTCPSAICGKVGKKRKERKKERKWMFLEMAFRVSMKMTFRTGEKLTNFDMNSHQRTMTSYQIRVSFSRNIFITKYHEDA